MFESNYKIFLEKLSNKDEAYLLKELTIIYNSLKKSISSNPYKDYKLENWKITNAVNFEDISESNLVLRNDTTKEDINITFNKLDELTEDDNKFKIVGVNLYMDNGKKDKNFKLDNYIYSICNSILELLEKNTK